MHVTKSQQKKSAPEEERDAEEEDGEVEGVLHVHLLEGGPHGGADDHGEADGHA